MSQRAGKEREVRIIVALLVVSTLLAPLLVHAQREPAGVVIIAAQENPTAEYLAFFTAFNTALIERWKASRGEVAVMGGWGIIIIENNDEIFVSAIRNGEGARQVLVASIPPAKRLSRVTAEAVARRTMHLIMAEETREGRVGR